MANGAFEIGAYFHIPYITNIIHQAGTKIYYRYYYTIQIGQFRIHI